MAWSASESFTLASCIAKSASGIVSRAVDVAFGSPSRVFTGDSGGWFLPVGEIMSARASSTNVETTPSVTRVLDRELLCHQFHRLSRREGGIRG